MRHIGIFDSNNTPIFEGDTLEITVLDDMQFNDNFLQFLKVDRITIYIAPLQLGVGVKLEFQFWSGGQKVLNEKEASFHRSNSLSEEDIAKHFSGAAMSEPASYIAESWRNPMFISHGFIHRKSKTIIQSEVDINKRSDITSAVSVKDLNVTVGGIKYPASETKFLVELTDSAKDAVLEADSTLYDYETEGGFTHILLKPSDVSLHDYQLDCEPVDKDGHHTLYAIHHDHGKYMKLARPIKERWKQRIDQWISENNHLSEKVISEKRKDMWKLAKAEFEPLRESKGTELRTVRKDIFLCLSSSINLFEFFDHHKCLIKQFH